MKEANLKRFSPQQQVEYIKKSLGYQTYARPIKYWLDTGSKHLNAVLGSRVKGLAYGKIITLAGKPSGGKTLLQLMLAGLAQQDGAQVAHVDIENSFDAEWAAIHGLDAKKMVVFQPEIGVFGKTKRQASVAERLQTAEELFTVVEKWLMLQRKLHPQGKLFLGVDSTTAIQPEEEMVAGFTDQNMRSRMSPAMFLNRLTKGLVPLALNCNAIVVLVSQLRTNPAQMFGDPEYIPGGNGVLFYPSVIVKVRRVKNGRILQKGKVVGLRSVITNIKNKAGEGSVEGERCGFKAYFREYKWTFASAEEMLRDAKEEENE